MSTPESDILIVGAGPSGLAVAHALRERGLTYHQVEQHSAVGGLWDIDNPYTPMYETAHFISSRRLSGFDDFPLPPQLADYPGQRDILAYLRSYAEHFDLVDDIDFGVRVDHIEPAGQSTDDGWLVHTTRLADGTQHSHIYRDVVCCSGFLQTPSVPPLDGEFNGEIRHSASYRSPREFEGKRTLVVGAGNSGCDISVDAGRTGVKTYLSMRRGYWFIPKHVLGKPVDELSHGGPKLPLWLEQRLLQLLLRVYQGKPEKLGMPAPDHKIFETHPIVNSTLIPAIQGGDVEVVGPIDHADGDDIVLKDGRRLTVDVLLWATGYTHTIPYAEALFGNGGAPDLYLRTFSPEYDGIYAVGFLETNAAAYPHIDLSAQMVAEYCQDRRTNVARAQRLRQRVKTRQPDLTGGIRFVNTERHVNYTDSPALRAAQETEFDAMGWWRHSVVEPKPSRMSGSSAH